MSKIIAADSSATNAGHDRLKQTAAMFFYLFLLVISPFVALFAAIFLAIFPPLWPLLGLYLVWFVYDFRTPYRGSRCNELAYNWPIWTHLANFFPIEVQKTAEIPPHQNYIFSMHPHGILGSSSMVLCATNGLNFRRHFPGIKMHLATLDINFWIPFRREILLMGNVISAESEAIEYVLSRPQGGQAVGIVPGGAAEALYSFPGNQQLVLTKRKGFVRLAIKHGASIVPVYHFGETDLFEQLPMSPEGSYFRIFQDFVKRHTGITFPRIYGQNYFVSLLPPSWSAKLPKFLTIGLVPYRRKIVTIVGAPIRVPKDANPAPELVDAVHAEYCAKLKALFDENKTTRGGLPANAQLEFV